MQGSWRGSHGAKDQPVLKVLVSSCRETKGELAQEIGHGRVFSHRSATARGLPVFPPSRRLPPPGFGFAPPLSPFFFTSSLFPALSSCFKLQVASPPRGSACPLPTTLERILLAHAGIPLCPSKLSRKLRSPALAGALEPYQPLRRRDGHGVKDAPGACLGSALFSPIPPLLTSSTPSRSICRASAVNEDAKTMQNTSNLVPRSLVVGVAGRGGMKGISLYLSLRQNVAKAKGP